jgi:hypothetical protein
VDERHFFFNFYLVAAEGLHWEKGVMYFHGLNPSLHFMRAKPLRR